MRTARWALAALALALLVSDTRLFTHPPVAPAQAPARGDDPQETHLRNLRMLTDGGENAEAYFSFDGRRLIFQATPASGGCDQIYTMNADGTGRTLVSTGKGRTTCAYFFPDGRSIVYGSTHAASAACPPKPGFDQGYVWPVYASYDIYRANEDGSNLRALTSTPGYDA